MAKRSNIAVYSRLITMVGSLMPVMVLAIIFGILGFLCSTFMSVFGAWGILVGLGLPSTHALSYFIVWMIVVAFLRGPLRYAEQMCNHYIAFKILAQVRHKVFTVLRTLAPAKLEAKNKGELIFLITSDIELLEVFYAHTISPVAIAIGMGIIMTVYIASFNLVLGLFAAFAFVMVGWVLPKTVTKLGGDSAAEHRQKAGRMSGYVLDSLRGLREILQFNRGQERLEELDRRTDHMSETEREMKLKSARALSMGNMLIVLLDVFFLAIAATLYMQGSITVASALICFVALVSSYGPFLALANLGTTLQTTTASANRVLDILDEKTVQRLGTFTSATARSPSSRA